MHLPSQAPECILLGSTLVDKPHHCPELSMIDIPDHPFVIVVEAVTEGSGVIIGIPLSGFRIETIVLEFVPGILFGYTREQGIPTLKDESQIPVFLR
jgi:hypothetical protein